MAIAPWMERDNGNNGVLGGGKIATVGEVFMSGR
jgi:hypothetical protein